MNELETIGRKLRLARDRQRLVTEAARQAALTALDSGTTEVEVARSLGVDRMTVRKWAGKQKRRGCPQCGTDCDST